MKIKSNNGVRIKVEKESKKQEKKPNKSQYFTKKTSKKQNIYYFLSKINNCIDMET